MLTWVTQVGVTTHLHAYGGRMELLAHLIEHGDRWEMTVGGRQFNVAGNGCADPVAFIEQMVSPSVFREYPTDEDWVVQFFTPYGENWEVWGGR